MKASAPRGRRQGQVVNIEKSSMAMRVDPSSA
nr:MAG TPA: hypothetical protein [Caudoviricetes sp.]